MEGMKYLIALLAVAGIVVSSMALHVHYMDPGAAPPCAVTEKFDCGSVNHSKYAVFPPITDDEYDDSTGQLHPNKLHIPVAIVGIAGYGLIGVVALWGRMRMVLELSRIGFFCAAFLSYLEAYVIHKWCIYCLWSQCIITAILLASVVAVMIQRRRRAESMVSVLAGHVD
jgi:vitamin-K-epoxide reductase (warfarin-sensitive)